jgi:hypothetical protein
MDIGYRAWIFVSHASDDILRVREVRNYLESKGAAPLLFHLKALSKPEEFWPIIEREIAARNFFLYCQSAIAEKRDWVRRERAAVEAAGRERPIRVDSIRVDSGDLDFAKLDAFVSKTRVFPTYAHQDQEVVRPFLLAMEQSGFQVFITERDLPPGARWITVLDQELEAAARDGWVVAFFSNRSKPSEWVGYEIGFSEAAGGKIIPVMLNSGMELPVFLSGLQAFDATIDPATAPDRLVRLMMHR